MGTKGTETPKITNKSIYSIIRTFYLEFQVFLFPQFPLQFPATKFLLTISINTASVLTRDYWLLYVIFCKCKHFNINCISFYFMSISNILASTGLGSFHCVQFTFVRKCLFSTYTSSTLPNLIKYYLKPCIHSMPASFQVQIQTI